MRASACARTREMLITLPIFVDNYVDNSNLTSGYVDKYVDNLLIT